MADPKEINYYNGEKLYNKEKVDELLTTKQDSITPDTAVKDSENLVTNSAVKAYVDKETVERKEADGDLDELKTTTKSNLVEAINELKDSAYTVDDSLSDTSTNPVQNKAVKKYVDDGDANTLGTARQYTDDKLDLNTNDGSTVTELTGHLEDLNNAAESLVSAINKLDEKYGSLPDVDEAPVEDSEHLVKSGGVFDAIRFASVKVGETMYWPVSEKETRTVHSDGTFEFTFNGETHTVTPADGTVDMCISKDIPDGWHALDGSVELTAADYPDLAAFMPDNVTTDGRIWLPYVQQKIIKVKY